MATKLFNLFDGSKHPKTARNRNYLKSRLRVDLLERRDAPAGLMGMLSDGSSSSGSDLSLEDVTGDLDASDVAEEVSTMVAGETDSGRNVSGNDSDARGDAANDNRVDNDSPVDAVDNSVANDNTVDAGESLSDNQAANDSGNVDTGDVETGDVNIGDVGEIDVGGIDAVDNVFSGNDVGQLDDSLQFGDIGEVGDVTDFGSGNDLSAGNIDDAMADLSSDTDADAVTDAVDDVDADAIVDAVTDADAAADAMFEDESSSVSNS